MTQPHSGPGQPLQATPGRDQEIKKSRLRADQTMDHTRGTGGARDGKYFTTKYFAENGQNQTKIYCMKMVTTGLVGRNQKLLSFAFAARGSDWVTQPRLIVRARTGFAATITWHLDVNCN